MTMTIQEAVEKINSRQATRKDIALKMGVSPNTLTRKIKKEGYEYDQSTKQYSLASPIINERKNEPTNEPKKQGSNERKKERTNVVRKRSSFDLDIELVRQLKVKSALEDKNVYEMVEQAIRNYLKK